MSRNSEHVELVWPGKYGADGRRRRPRAPVPIVDSKGWTLKRPGRGAGADSRLICADLCDALPALREESVDFAYLDPPFRTDRDRCGSNGSTLGYPDRWRLDEYLNFLDDAIQLIRPMLKPSGLIAIHTDHRASAHVRCLLDEHFSERRFVNEIIWKYGLGNAKASRHFLRKHDTIAVYARSRDYYFATLRGEVTAAQASKYRHEDEHGRYMLSYGRRYYLKGGKPLESVLGIPSIGPTQNERCGWPTQKPLRLLEVLIEAFCPPGGVVLDPCCGSGTTAVAAARLGRRWIAIDEQPAAIELAADRLAREGRSIEAEARQDERLVELHDPGDGGSDA